MSPRLAGLVEQMCCAWSAIGTAEASEPPSGAKFPIDPPQPASVVATTTNGVEKTNFSRLPDFDSNQTGN